MGTEVDTSSSEATASSASLSASVLVSWTLSPAPGTQMQQYYYFIVKYKPAAESSVSGTMWMNISTDQYQTSVLVTSLTRNTDYLVRVIPVRQLNNQSDIGTGSAEIHYMPGMWALKLWLWRFIHLFLAAGRIQTQLNRYVYQRAQTRRGVSTAVTRVGTVPPCHQDVTQWPVTVQPLVISGTLATSAL